MSPLFMALLLLLGWGIFAYSTYRRWKLMRVGAGEDRFDQPAKRLRAVWSYGLKQLRMRRYPLAGAAHMLIFLGFGVLLLRTLILWGRGFDESFNMWLFGVDQPLGKVYSLLKDIFVVLVILGTLVFVYYRVVKRLSRMTLSVEGLIILGIILTMMVADVLYDGANLVLEARSAVASADGTAIQKAGLTFHAWEPAGSIMQYALNPLSSDAVRVCGHIGFWTHSALVLIFLNLLPYSKHFHVITGLPNVYLQSLYPPGRLPPIVDIEGKLEREETLGIRRINQFSWKSILDFYTCTECGRCSDYCPATNTGKKLSPKHFTLDLRDFLYQHEKSLVTARNGQSSGASNGNDESAEHGKDLVDGVIDPEVLWACTSCRACEQECPVFISYVDKIVDMRRYLVQERGEFPNELQSAFRSMESSANPWGFPATDRGNWADGLGIRTLAEHPDAPVIFWIGCMPSFDERAKKVSRATAQLLQKAGVDFAILGQEEQCTGDPARRSGNEFLFQMFAQANVEVLNNYGADKKKIITSCPHCFNTLLNEYPDFGGRYEVIHHTTFLAELVAQGKLKPVKPLDKRVVYHDSCYLGRYNEVYDAPRETLRAIPGLTVLEPEATRDRGMCCGAGGAQMFKEEEPGDQRVNDVRTQQLLDTQPDAVASACPFCQRMLTDGLAGRNREDVPQMDIAEMLLESVET
jgi:Fe-S oxidoreductase